MRRSNVGFLVGAALTAWAIWASLVLQSASSVGTDLSAMGRMMTLVVAMLFTAAVLELRARRR